MFSNVEDFEEYYLNIEQEWTQYLLDTNQQCYYSAADTSQCGDVTVNLFDYCHRWSNSYVNRFLKKLYKLQEWYLLFPCPVTFLTLTTYQPKGQLIEDQIILLKQSWNKLIRVLRKDIPGLQYIWAMDFHKTGYGHLHIILFDKIDPIKVLKYQMLWETQYLAGSAKNGITFKFKEQDHIMYLVSYLFKHTAKVFISSKDVIGFKRFHSVIWSMGRNSSYASEGLYADEQIQTYPGVPSYQQIRLFGVSRRIASAMKLTPEDKRVIKVNHTYSPGDETSTIYQDGNEKLDEVYKWYLMNNKKRVDKGVDFFCSLDI